jgi:hypothetical protein
MDDEKKQELELKLAFSAQKGWSYDEFGDFLQDIIRGKGHNTHFYRLLKQLYDNKTEFTYETVARGEEKIDLPSLSLIGTTTPDSLAPITGRDSTVWTDGAFARIAFITPPAGSMNLNSAPDGKATVPDEIRIHLQTWNENLDIPECHVIDLEEQEDLLEQAHGKGARKKDNSIRYKIERAPLPQNDLYWYGSGIREAHEAYYKALMELTNTDSFDERLNSNYIRFPDMALKIAMVLASLENGNKMDMRHWARGQAVVERWRRDLHSLMSQLSNGEGSTSYGALEATIIHVLNTKFKGKKAIVRDIAQAGSKFLREAGSPKVREICEELHADGVLARDGQGRGAKYGIK